MISGNHQPLIEKLQVNRKISSVTDLLEIDDSEWKKILTETGIPSFIKGNNEEEKAKKYSELIQNTLNAAYPTQKIAAMLNKMSFL